MSLDKEYFRIIMEAILPELNSGQMTIRPYDEAENTRPNPHLMNAADPKAIIYFIPGGNTFDSISIPPCTDAKIQINPLRIHQFFKNHNIVGSSMKALATFAALKRPAILYDPKSNIIYLLFNLQELVFRLSTLEHESGKSDKHGRFLAAYLNDYSSWKYPTLDMIGELIRDQLDLSYRDRKHGVILTHDVDRVGLEPFLLLKNIYKNKKIGLNCFAEQKDRLFQNIIEIANIDSRHNINSLWFCLAGKYSLRRYGNRYSINSSKSKKLILAIKRNQHHVGLHTSYYAAFNTEAILSEKDRLAQFSGKPIKFIRNHYLRFDIQKSISNFEDCGMKLDSTLGFPDKNGFRTGMARPFYLWNHKANRISKVLELPLLFMDSVHGDDLAASWDDILRIISLIKSIKGCGAFLFHPCFVAENEEKREFYLNFLQECNRMNIPFVCAQDLLNENPNRRQ